MFVKVKIENKVQKVDVCCTDCPYYKCFSPHKYQHRSYNATEGSMTYVDEHYSCSYRNYHGCPDKPARR